MGNSGFLPGFPIKGVTNLDTPFDKELINSWRPMCLNGGNVTMVSEVKHVLVAEEN